MSSVAWVLVAVALFLVSALARRHELLKVQQERALRAEERADDLSEFVDDLTDRVDGLMAQCRRWRGLYLTARQEPGRLAEALRTKTQDCAAWELKPVQQPRIDDDDAA